jgi:hypothetical protein
VNGRGSTTKRECSAGSATAACTNLRATREQAGTPALGPRAHCAGHPRLEGAPERTVDVDIEVHERAVAEGATLAAIYASRTRRQQRVTTRPPQR